MWKWNIFFGVRITFCAHAHTQNTSCPAVVHATHIFRLFFVICAHFGAIMNKIRCLKSNLCDVRKLKIYCRHVWCVVTQHIACMIALTAPTASVICAFFLLMFETSGVHSTWTFPHEMHSPKWGTKDVKNDKHSTLRVPPISGWHSLCKRRGRVNSTC